MISYTSGSSYSLMGFARGVTNDPISIVFPGYSTNRCCRTASKVGT